MNKHKKETMLVVGSDSFIGEALMRHLKGLGKKVMGTTRRRERVDHEHIYLDLMEDMGKWVAPFPVDVAFLCAGITKMDDCRSDPLTSRRINVEGISKISKNFVSRGVFVVYLSTDKVFDGSKFRTDPTAAYSFRTEYGRQKAEAETKFRSLGESVSIVRLTKVLTSKDPLFALWTKVLERGERIYPFNDLLMSPVLLPDVVSVLDRIAEKRLSGVFQLSSSDEISYAEAAYLGARILKADEALVQPIKASQSGRYDEPVPVHSTLNTNRLKKELGVELPDARCVIEKIFMSYMGGSRQGTQLNKLLGGAEESLKD